MASMEIMREFVSRQYGGSWREKVKKMPDNQVASIYHRMIFELDVMKSKPENPRLRMTEVGGGDQLSFFDNQRTLKIKEEYLNGGTDEAAGEGYKKSDKDPGGRKDPDKGQP